MSDETAIAAEVADSVRSKGAIGGENSANLRQPDSARGKRGPAATILQARTGLALANGADSMAEAMRTAGYAESSTRNPAQTGLTPAKALAAAAATFPSARKTLRALRPKAISVLDRGMDLDKDERPDQSHLQASALALKLGSELDDADDDRVTDVMAHNARRQIRLEARRFARAALRRAEEIGVSAALDELQAFEAAERQRWPLRGEINAERARGTYGNRQ